jgi:hypothetical protein
MVSARGQGRRWDEMDEEKTSPLRDWIEDVERGRRSFAL